MQQDSYTRPVQVFCLILPSGISNGFVSVVLPFLLTRQGFPVSTTAAIVAFGLSANLWRFAWGPLVDVSLSLRKWYWISLSASILTLLLICFVPFSLSGAGLLSAIVFLSQVAATLLLLPINGIMAKAVAEKQKGAASGWYQAGSLAGTGIGGGAGLWLANHFSVAIAGIVLCLASALFAIAILFVRDIPREKNGNAATQLRNMGKDLVSLVRIPVSRYVLVLLLMPMGSGAIAYLWSAVAQDWHAGAGTVELVTGLLNGVASAAGCIAGGMLADKLGIWRSYLGCGAFCGFVALLIALLPMHPAVYAGGVLVYGFATGMVYATFTALVLYATGKKHVATRFSLLCSIGNLPVVYMTAFDGWTHDRFGTRSMLVGEALPGIATALLFAWILQQMRRKELVSETVG